MQVISWKLNVLNILHAETLLISKFIPFPPTCSCLIQYLVVLAQKRFSILFVALAI